MIKKESKIFQKVDKEIRVFDFPRKKMLVANPLKGLCIGYDLVNSNDYFDFGSMIKQVWSPNSTLTEYLGIQKIHFQENSKTY